MVRTSPSAPMTVPCPMRSVPRMAAVNASSGISACTRTTHWSAAARSNRSCSGLGCRRGGKAQLLVSAIGGAAEEQVGGQHIQRLEPAAHVAEDPLQVLQYAGRELVHEERAARLEHITGLAQDALAQGCRNGAEGDAGDDVARLAVAELVQNLVNRDRGRLHYVQPPIGE